MRGAWWLIPIVLFLGFITLAVLPDIYADWVWFESFGQLSVYTLRFTVQALLLVLVGGVSAAFLVFNVAIARRYALADSFTIPMRRGSGPVEVDLRPITRVMLAVAGLIGVFMGLVAMGAWDDWVRYQNGTPFGVLDPILGMDAGFYIFDLPIWQDVRVWLSGLFFVAIAFTLLIYGGGRPLAAMAKRNVQGEGIVHLSLLGAGWLAIQAAGYWLSRYEQMFTAGELVSGPGYTAVNATIPIYGLLAGVVALAMLALIGNIFVRRLVVVWVALGLWVVLAIIGEAYPALIQDFVVTPNQFARERDYLEHAITFTRQAYDLNEVHESEYKMDDNTPAAAVLSDTETIDNIRLWDYRPLLITFRQIQEIRRYYDFTDVDVNSYELDGKPRQIMLSAREINVSQLPEQALTWVNRHLVYTHGYGVTANRVNEIGDKGLPALVVRDIPPVSSVPELTVTRPELYFGEITTDYAIVDTNEDEFDYPVGTENAYTQYQGKGYGSGALSGFFPRLMYALSTGDMEILISGAINSNSRILYRRDLTTRLNRLAPFLMYETDPYLLVVNGRLVWVVDAFTHTSRYPYSAAYNGQYDGAYAGMFNYIRNSVRVTIDAYDGTTTFYIVDPTDPIIQTWQKIYPSLFVSIDQLDRATFARLRYPELMFTVQAEMYATYHMRDVQVFYNKEDQWQFANEKHGDVAQPIEPYYVIVRLPGRPSADSVLMLPFTPAGKDNLSAWLYVDSDGENFGEMGVYNFGKQTLVYGPLQIENRIDQDPAISPQLTLWNQEGSQVVRGNLLVIPVRGGLLYVEPIYLQAAVNGNGGGIPELTRVIVAYRNEIAMTNTLAQALEQVFGVAQTDPNIPPPATDVASLAQSAQANYERGQACLLAQDWACYGEAQSALERDLEALVAATGGSTPTAPPTATPQP